MSEGGFDRIWHPVVNPTGGSLPRPSQLASGAQELYTKTSLRRDQDRDRDREDESDLRSLNGRIISASQSYNNSPKPFVRQTTLPARLKQQVGRREPVFSRQDTGKAAQSLAQSSGPLHATGTSTALLSPPLSPERRSGKSEMATQKLVHEQYNSPINLYSMSNIRKTIEAHSELIAPGVKGINFMKSDTPVNKQSEVYKLVMEQEGEGQASAKLPISHRADHPARISSISCQPSQAPRGSHHQHCSCIGEQKQSNYNHQYNHQQEVIRQEHDQQQMSAATSTKLDHMSHLEGQSNVDKSSASRQPKCSECGQFIVGPFAKVQNRNIHPHCFGCTTCGTSLKNCGFFTINEKLYCEIHAKQVANLMRSNYNFDANRQLTDGTTNINNNHQAATSSTRREEDKLLVSSAQQQRQRFHHSTTFDNSHTNQATIATMFADRPTNNSHCAVYGNSCDENKTCWNRSTTCGENFGPLSSQNTDSSATTSSSRSSSSMKTMTAYEQQLHRQASNLHQQFSTTSSSSLSSTKGGQQQQQQLRSSIGVTQRDSSRLPADRMPVCMSCGHQIHGPYILAGKSTWCKPCSQTKLVCNSCNGSLLQLGFIEDHVSQKYYCEHCYEALYAPVCSKCNSKIRGDCLNALDRHWHPTCFVCGHCRNPFGNSSFYLEDNVPYCKRDWNILFTTKCFSCSYPIEAGDKWIEALEHSYHSDCFRCASCQTKLEGSTFYCKGGKPFCKLHAR